MRATPRQILRNLREIDVENPNVDRRRPLPGPGRRSVVFNNASNVVLGSALAVHPDHRVVAVASAFALMRFANGFAMGTVEKRGSRSQRQAQTDAQGPNASGTAFLSGAKLGLVTALSAVPVVGPLVAGSMAVSDAFDTAYYLRGGGVLAEE